MNKHSIAITILAATLMCWTQSANGSPIAQEMRNETFGDSILVQRKKNGRSQKVQLYPNADHQVLFFGVNGEKGKIYQLFLFDMEGKLVRQTNIRSKQTTVLNNIDKGNYIFEVFSEDERIETGQVIIK
jgi:lipopolysaccharide export LptBFGC system permease protein LptF